MSQIFDVQIWDFGFASFSTSILTLFNFIWDWERVGLKNLILSSYNLYFRVWLVDSLTFVKLDKKLSITVENIYNAFPCLLSCWKHIVWYLTLCGIPNVIVFFCLVSSRTLSLPSWEVFLISHFAFPPYLHSFISHHSTTMKHGLSYWSILRVRDWGLGV